MSVPNWKERYNPILVLCIAVAFCAALYLMQIRVGIEKRNDTVEQTLDYQGILMMAQREGYSSEKLLQQFKDAGVTTLIVYDTTLERLEGKSESPPCRGMCCKRRLPVCTGAILTRSLLRRLWTRTQYM